ncbi:MAG TPA: hypothetical protein VMY05_09995 [Acidobacteriota bacterium]|nr:hypothetical protein [Acidobacteriota bacterium]
MKADARKPFKVQPVCLVGDRSSFLSPDGLGFVDIEDRAEQERRTSEILSHLAMDLADKVLVRSESDLLRLDTGADVFLVFVHCMHKFSALEALARTGIPLILAGEEGAPGDAFDTYSSIADCDNVHVAFSYDGIARRARVLRAAAYVRKATVCVFDSGERSLDAAPWYRNPVVDGTLKTAYVDMEDFRRELTRADTDEAERLAKSWMEGAMVLEPTLQDVRQSAVLYLAMKSVIDGMGAEAAYVLWCGQFSELVGGKMCYAIAKLNETGYLTGCWRGENAAPMMILHALSGKPVFFGEVHTYGGDVMAVRHCAVPCNMAAGPPVLRTWRGHEGTVTAYCEMPRGTVTVVNMGIGDRLVVLKGEVTETRDLGGENCRTTVMVQLHNPPAPRQFVSREMAMVYGDFVDDVLAVAGTLHIRSD